MISTYWRELACLDRLVAHPPRLAVLDLLRDHKDSADFQRIKACTGLTQGNLGNHLSRLAEAGLVEIHKEFVGNRPRTTVVLTEEDRRAVGEFLSRMEELSERWRERD